MTAARDVGGDFYDFYMRDDRHLVVTIADVCGKGIPAALFMMRAKTILKNQVMMANVPDDFAAVMSLANQELCRDNEEEMFVTVFLAQLDLGTGELIYVNGGHNPPLVRQNGNVRYLLQKKYEIALGMIEEADYEIRMVMDLVFNHSSEQHAWFLESKQSRTNPKADWYIWRDAKPDGSPPTNWRSSFGGSAWAWCEERQQYYLHTFAPQ